MCSLKVHFRSAIFFSSSHTPSIGLGSCTLSYEPWSFGFIPKREAQVDIKGEKGFFGNPDWDPETSMTLVSSFCQMSSVRSTSDGRGPVTRKRVPDREEQGKPSKDARRGHLSSP